jgi:hypothetical protein
MPRKRKDGDQGRKGPAKHGPEPVAKGDLTGRGDKPVEPELLKPADDEQEYTELVLLVHAANLPEAELFKTELAAHGIPAFLEGEGAGVAGIPDVGAGVPVLVPEEFADQAAELIAELESAKPEGNALDEKEDLFDEDDDEDEEEAEELDEVEDLDDDLDEEDDDDLDEDDDDLDEDEDWEEDEDDDDDEDWDDDEDDEEF